MSADATNWVTSLREVNMTWLDREIEEEDSYKNNIEKNVLQILETLLSFCGKTHGKQLDSCQIFLLMHLFIQGKLALSSFDNTIQFLWTASLHPTHTHQNRRWYNLTPCQKVRHTFAHWNSLDARMLQNTLCKPSYLKFTPTWCFFSLSLFPRLNSMGHYINDACSNAGANLSRQCASQPGTLPDYKTAALLCV